MSNCLEERIEDLCKLSFFLHPIQKITTRIRFPWLLAPKRLISLAVYKKTSATIYFWQVNNLNWITTIVCDPYFFLFLVFLYTTIFLVFSSISLNSQSIELYGFQKKRKFLQHNLSTEFYSVLLPPSSSSKVILLISPTIQFFFLMISQNWPLLCNCWKILSEFLGLVICVTS
jgi:hypothetical protein